MNYYFNAKFRCAHAIEWNVKLTNSIVMRFLDTSGTEMSNFVPELLTENQKFNLLWEGIKHHSSRKNIVGDTDDEKKEYFLDDGLQGNLLILAIDAVELAMVNFILPQRSDHGRVLLIKLVEKTIKTKEKLANMKSPKTKK